MTLKEFHIENVEEWGRYLVDKYPLILKEFDPDVAYYFKGEEKDRVNLRYGFEFCSGWKLLVEEFLAKATDLVQKDRAAGFTDSFIHTFIFKEKFGSLQNQGSSKLSPERQKEWDDFDSEIEERSFHTCEKCGQPGSISSTKYGWVEVRCLECLGTRK